MGIQTGAFSSSALAQMLFAFFASSSMVPLTASGFWRAFPEQEGIINGEENVRVPACFID
jgi:hypothetical protein